MSSHFRQLLKGTSLMSVAGILQKGVGFFLLPLYTRYLTPADYGAVELFLVLLLIVDICVQQGMASALMKRLAYDKADGSTENRGLAIGTALIFVLVSALIVGTVLIVAGAPFAHLLFDQEGYGYLIAFGAVQVLFMGAHKILLVPLRADQQYFKVTIVAFGIFLAKLGGNLVFLLGFNAGFASLIYGGFCGSVAALAMAWYFGRKHLRWGYDRAEVKVLTRFGRPLIFSGIGFLLLSSTDRVLLKVLLSGTEVGLYSIAAKIGLAVEMVLLGPFMRTWDTVYYKIAKQPDAKRVFAKFATRFLALAFFGTMGTHFFAPYVLQILTTPEFYAAAAAVGFFVLGQFLFAINDVLKVGMNIEARTHLLPVRVVCAGIVNVIAGILLIPPYGIAGAALATVIAYLFMDGFTIWACRTFYKVEYEWSQAAQLALAAGATFAAQLLLSGHGVALDIVLKTALLVAFAAVALRILKLDWRVWRKRPEDGSAA